MQHNAPILLAADNEDDAYFLRRAFVQAGLGNLLIAVQDGHEAVDYLAGTGPYTDRAAHPVPGLVLLDLHMPKMDGFEVLAWLSKRPDLKGLPVVVLSASAKESDIEKAFELGADDYQVQPLEFERLVDLVRKLHSRWLGGESKAS